MLAVSFLTQNTHSYYTHTHTLILHTHMHMVEGETNSQTHRQTDRNRKTIRAHRCMFCLIYR